MIEKRSMQLGTETIRWDEKGSGIPVVFVHGIPTSPELWRHVLPLVDGARCLALEMRGYGESMPERADRDISVDAQAERLLAWLDAINISRAILVGHDLGGGVVQIAAVRRRSLATGLVLMNCIAYDSWPIPSVKMMRAMGGLVRHLPALLVKAMVAPLFVRGHDDGGIARESLKVHWRHYAAHDAGAALIDQMKALDVNDTLRIADRLVELRGIPSRIVWGAADAFQKISYGERLATDLGAPLRRIEGGKHFVPEDHPEIVAAAIREVIAIAGADRAQP